ncbi:T9SS type A sorting domain-containing protein [Psychroserpens ponticola]|uniref:T9SS type A sorting domain-containing protein n=1 Tax=Psychroserpens ponticola TaxID=2932268 RepID=A0ABY7S076_9FLAO|nr:T9SS type A sorting domain-containing protein [Psychroserpens ponticola]WCO02375.1 T9SS type A sorting domain-containing protein [Psychroserpens ponticola]
MFLDATFCILIHLIEKPAVNIDDQLDFLATINPIGSDETPDDNEFSFEQEVIGSYDPNDITCLEGDIVSPDKIGDYLHYTINFENTGTAAATFVVVKDDIDETKFDMNTLRVMHASHEMMTRITDNRIEFVFDNINLEPEGRGNVVFKIKTLNSLSIGDSVSNKADIYFDYNYPIETNIATTTFDALSVDEFGLKNSVSVYPNPTNGQLFINSTYKIDDIILYDIQGRKVEGFNVSETNMLNISSVSKGVYFLEITSVKGKSTKKIIKD